MSRMEMQQLEQYMNHLAYLFQELGVTKADFFQGKINYEHNGAAINKALVNSLCQHISAIQRDELATGEDELPEFYFD